MLMVVNGASAAQITGSDNTSLQFALRPQLHKGGTLPDTSEEFVYEVRSKDLFHGRLTNNTSVGVVGRAGPVKDGHTQTLNINKMT